MQKIVSILILIVSYGVSFAQLDDNILAEYKFDNCTAEDENEFYHGQPLVNPECVCGFSGLAIKFDGNQEIQLGQRDAGLNNVITSAEFCISLAVHAEKNRGLMTVLSMTEDCDSYGFELMYNPSANQFILKIVSQTEVFSFPFEGDGDACWQHVVINRLFNRLDAVVNGDIKFEHKFPSNPNFESLGAPILGGGGCTGVSTSPFVGLIDEVRVYGRVLSIANAQLLSSNQLNKLSDNFQVIFTGQSYDVELFQACPGNVQWLPSAGVSDPGETKVSLSPSETTLYSVSAEYEGCTQIDTILIKVLDESSIDCNRLLLPNSFTPNNDGLNDTYGISTTYSIEGECRFEIFNMYGGKVFSSNSSEGRWDGTFQGNLAPPGTYMYKVKYTCSGESYNTAGSVNLIR